MDQAWIKLRILIFFVILPVVTAECTSIPYPKLLRECYDEMSTKFPTNDYPGELPSIICLNKYRWWTDSESCHPTVLPATLDYVRDLSERDHHKRDKRDATGPKRKRKEIRKLTKQELKKYFKALKMLKKKKVPGTNISLYHSLASIHNGDIARTAHIGPNFLVWHRVYLYAFENALHKVQPGVVLPYWDCTIEQGLEKPKLSNLFSKKFLGKAAGTFEKTRYGDSSMWNIVRNIETGGPLPSRLDFIKVLSRNRTVDIVVPFAYAPYNLEYLHNGIHSYIGGHLTSLDKATEDPIFFLLHCFIDYIYEKFRQRQKSLDIDPTINIPDPGDSYLNGTHRPNANMSVFTNYTNADGYSDYWTDEVYEYEDSPSTCYRDCGSPNLVCINGLCYPKTVEGKPVPRKLTEEELIYFRGSNFNVDNDRGTVYDKDLKDREKNGDRVVNKSPNKRWRRSAQSKSDIETCSGPYCPGSDAPIQNIFSINGKHSDIDDWVFIAVKVTFFRPLNLHFNTFQYRNDSIDDAHDIFDSFYSKNLQSSMHVGHQGTYHNFCRVNSGGAGKVFVRSDGLNYSGYSMEYALVDERHPVSMGTAYVPVKSPVNSSTEVSLIAYDECGRSCLPTCLVNGSNPPRYIPCSGCVRLDNSSPHCYGKTVAGLIYNMWHFGQGTNADNGECPSVNHSAIFVNFLCDSSNVYPWDRFKE